MAMVSSLVCACVDAPAESDCTSESTAIESEVTKMDYKALGKPLVALTFDDGPNIVTNNMAMSPGAVSGAIIFRKK